MIIAHSIALDPTEAQEAYFRRACGTARYAYNWALVEWKRMHEAGENPGVFSVQRRWYAHKKTIPWAYEVTKSASATAIHNLGAAFANFFRDLKKLKGQRRARYPKFKKRGSGDRFKICNDYLHVNDRRIRIPKLGWVRMYEPLRFVGKIMGAVVSRRGTRWHVSIQVEIDDPARAPAAGAIVGVDLGVSALMTLSRPLPDGRTKIANPRARRSLMKQQRKIARRISRQELMRSKANAKTSGRQWRRRDALRKLHYRVASIRKDAIHKATSLIAATFSTIVLEDLNVSGMAKNHRLAGAVLDASFYEIRRQLEYKAKMRNGRVIVVDRFFPSSKMCSTCVYVLDQLPLQKREWMCPKCGSVHDRDANAALNLELVGTASPEPPAEDRLDTRGEMEALALPQKWRETTVAEPRTSRLRGKQRHIEAVKTSLETKP